MNKIFATLFFGILTLSATAQNPVLMTVNGKDVTRGEFEYAYNKNNTEGAVEQKSIEEYVDMFVNYKLKVAEAERLQLDTLSSFQQEYRTYRDMQLTPHLTAAAYIDSVAKSLYDRQVEMIDGKDLLNCSHILLIVKQTATESERRAIAARADSLHQLLLQGADFANLAKTCSEDPGSASNGGQLPVIYPGMTIKEFEDAAYQLQAGELSAPVFTPVGYHIIKMHERKPLEPFETLYPTIIASLKRQNIEEASAKAHLERIMAETGKTREEILLDVLEKQKETQPELEYLVQEYYDGLLLYEVAKTRVWDAAEDKAAQQKLFKKNRKKYTWKEPKFAGFIISAKNVNDLRRGQKLLKKGVPEGKDLRSYLKETINRDSVVIVVSGPMLAQKGANATIDHFAFGDNAATAKPLRKGYDYTGIAGKVRKKPAVYTDVREELRDELQQQLEREWVNELRKRFPFTINREILKTVNNH